MILISNDGKDKRIQFTADQIELFQEFRRWDSLPEVDRLYEGYIADVGPSIAVNALHYYQRWLRYGGAAM